MTEAKDWLEVLETTEFEPLPGTVNTYQSARLPDKLKFLSRRRAASKLLTCKDILNWFAAMKPAQLTS
jgi:hypothetical protein